MVENQKKLNIIWIVVDGVRNYPASDKYGKLDLMQEFAKESVEFTNAVTSAPSTLMSVSAMISSRSAHYISRDFGTFEYDKQMFPPLTDILKLNSYNVHTIHYYHPVREKMKNVLCPVSSKYWPKKINKYKKWDEDSINSIFLKLIKNGLKEPFFLFMQYNVPTNNKSTSKKVGWVLKKLKEKNLYDNSIIILCSDHGYIDPLRIVVPLKQKITAGGHDIFVTNDNIMIPLIIKYPNCPKNHKVTNVVSSLDITPTILSVLGIPYKKYGFEGLNLLRFIKGKKPIARKVRTDTRFYFQPNKISSLKGSKYKYVYYAEKPPKQRENFFDIKKDKYEQKNLIHSKNKKVTNKLNEFKKEFKLSEKKAVEFQEEYLGQKFKALFNNINPKQIKKVLVFGTSSMLFVDILLSNLTQSFKGAVIDLIIKKNPAKELKTKSKKINFIFSNLTYNHFKKRLKRIKNTRYDLLIIPLANHLGIGYHQIFKIARRIRTNKVIRVDYNMALIKESNMWTAILKDLRKDLAVNLFEWKNFAGNLVLLAKRIMFDKYF